MATPIGIKIPIDKGNGGTYFESTYTSLEAAKTNMKSLLLTIPGERVMHPTFGSNLHALLFEPMNDENDLQFLIDKAIRDAVDVWLPHVFISLVESSLESDSNLVNVMIHFGLKNDPKKIETMYLSISRGEI